MSLDLGTLSAKVRVDASGVSSELGKVKRDLNDVKKEADKVSSTKLRVSPEGEDKLKSASKSAQQLGSDLEKASQSGARLRVGEQPAQELDKAASAGRGLGEVLVGLGNVAPLVGLAAAGAGVAGAFQEALKLGNEFTNQLNTVRAVSGATEGQLAAVSQRARELGKDTSLANTSASDAALAMSELAKGGFEVDQAMAAAKGTLQLAAAAQIDAGTAATIQAQALNSFGLEADYAAKAADVLANAANASTAEMTDIAAGLQQSGAVAHQFGLSIEDTAAALGMFANAGITGSDAGTLLKTALLAVTDQGKPAQQAIEELGLTIYDANGKFVGMHSLMAQLGDAAGRMTDEQYQAATATLFGSDAMRLAGIAATDGSSGFDQMRAAVDRAGAAADVAAAKTQGLPGAIAAVQNNAEELALTLYDQFSPALEAGLTHLAGGLDLLGPAIEGVGGAMRAIPGPVFTAMLAAAATKMLDLNTRMTSGIGAINGYANTVRTQFMSALGTVRTSSAEASSLLRQRRADLAATAAAERSYAATVGSAHASALATSRAMDAEWRGRLTGMQTAAVAFAGGTRGALEVGFNGIKTAAGGLMGFLGGPWGLAFTAAAGVVSHLANKHMEAKQAEEQHQQQQGLLKDSLDQTTGAITAQTNELQRKKAEEEGWLDTARQLGVSSEDVVSAMNGNEAAMRRVRTATDEATRSVIEGSAKWQESKDRYAEAGVSLDLLTSAVNGNKDAQQELASIMGSDGDLNYWASAVDDATESARGLRDGVTGAADDVAKMQDALKADQINNMANVANQTREAFYQLGDSIKSVPDDKSIIVTSMAPEVREQFRQLGAEVEEGANGEVKLTFPDGMNIMAMLDQIGAKATTMPDGRVNLSDNTPEVKQRLIDLGLAKDINGQLVMTDNLSEVMNKQMELGAVVRDPLNGELKVNDNIGFVRTALAELGVQTRNLPAGSVRIADDTPKVRGALTQLGIQTTTLPGGHVAITDTTAQNLLALQDLGVKTQSLPPGHVAITDTTPENMARLNELGIKTTTLPNGQVIISDNANETANHVKSTLAPERVNTFSDHTVNIVRRITDIFTRSREDRDGGVYDGAQRAVAFADGGTTRALEQAYAGPRKEPAHVATITPPGTYRVHGESETGGEAYIPLAESKRDRSTRILNTVAQRFGYNLVTNEGQAVALANGAILPGPAVAEKLRYMDGTPYIFGGWSRAGVDCSGAVSLGVNAALGLDEWDSRTATAGEGDWLRNKGFQPGKGQSGDIRVAFLNGGPGGGHTAMQLDDGTYIESGGNTGGGFTIGKKAGPLEGRGFTDFYHLSGAQPLDPGVGLEYFDKLDGAVGALAKRATKAAGDFDDTTPASTEPKRELNGGAGPLLKDGSVLELVAALHSARTGTPMDDDVVSWGQAIGLYSELADKDAAKLEKTQGKGVDKLTKSIASDTEKLDAKRADLPLAEEDLRIATMKRDETYGSEKATDSQKAAADQRVAKAEDKVNTLKAEIEQLEQKMRDQQEELARIRGDVLTPTGGLDKIGGTSGNRYADEIIKEGRRRGISDRGVQIALATALVESGLKMYANPQDPESMQLPHDAVGYDHDSVGLFQQRNNGAWGTTADRMDPARSAGMFYDVLDDADYNQGDPGAHAQRVQRSAFPGRYAEKMGEAQQLLERYNNMPSITAMANGGFLGNARQASINEGSAVLWAEAGPEAYIPLSSNKREQSLEIWAETGKRLGVDVLSMLNLIGAGLPGLLQGKINISGGQSTSLSALGLNMEALAYRGQRGAQDAVQNAVGAVFNGPVQINDPKQYLQGQLDNAAQQLGNAMRSVMLR
ncbi:phage tail tape measure protein [Corynebacterium liangguodongii]|uniref:Phage tail tape measure protein n=1 Tax=Corynebacterium liangguodongii TaxID=2079535 RepID=A0A2S0WG72_9CORY|nr:phage tail tape measure protein [Corynebacterium liangguodongii]AWB84773.1 phage tail tape measure protein [Corynebacterium liangguodongii]PWB99131.1 phage tail tape measure protein [Corynebacterium liangguodongii]